MAKNKVHELFIAHYQENKDKVFTYFMYRLNFNRDVCEDLLMEVFLKAYENFDQFDQSKGSFKSWIFRIAHNHLVNYWRDHKNELPLEEAESVSTEMQPEDLPVPGIHKVLELLSDVEREIITLRFLNDLSYQEIGEIIGKKEGAVRTGVSRSLNRFKTLYVKLYEST